MEFLCHRTKAYDSYRKIGLIMKLTTFLMLAGILHAGAKGFTQTVTLSASRLSRPCKPSNYAWNARAELLLATFFLALNWFGDSLDGTVARVRNRQRPRYGFYVDHMIDTFGGLFLMGGLAISDIVDWRIALGMFIAFLMLSVEVYLATYTLGNFQLSFAKFGPTEIRILLAIGNIALFFRPDAKIPGMPYRLFAFGGAIAIAAMAVMLLVAATSHTITLYREETTIK